MRLRALVIAALLPAATGCYVARAAHGQLEILVGQQPIDRVVEGDLLSADEARKLVMVEEVRRFAVREIGLVAGENYTTFYDTRGRPVSYAVSACRKDRFESYTWWFPIVGSFPYKGHFKKEDALAEARELQAQGYDVTVREIAAYSTLGWFRDPVFSRMLRRSEADLAALVLHELTHGTVFSTVSADFNEEMATFLGNRAALQFLSGRYGADAPEVARARAQFEDDEMFDRFLRALYERLDRLYASDLSTEEKLRRREEEFAGAKQEFRRLRTLMKTPSYVFFENLALNNAEIVANVRYGGHAKFERVFRRAGGSWVTFLAWMRLAAAAPDPQKAVELLAAGELP
jgi:predicted aminopeptidase